MSRCFSYPPPGYTPSRGSDEALIETIKLQKEREKTKVKELRKKEKKREKEEKRKEKNDKAHQNLEKLNIVQGHIGDKFLPDAKAKEKELRKIEKKRLKEEKRKQKKEKKHKNLEKCNIVQGHIGEKVCADAPGGLLHKRTVAEVEQLEQGSSLTEEHGQPVYLCEPSTSSDSTENSNKRKRECSSMDVSGGHGKIVRIRLSSKKSSEPDVSAKEQEPCFTSGRTYSLSHDNNDIGIRPKRVNFCSTSEPPSSIHKGFTPVTGRQQQICSTSWQIDTTAPRGTGTPSKTKAPPMRPVQRVELQYQSLTSNWALPSLQDATLKPQNLDWLFQGNKSGDAEKRQICRNDSNFCSSSSMLWPSAQYLQEVDVYAMPFTVPF